MLAATPPDLLLRTFVHTYPHTEPAAITTGPGGSVWVAAAPNSVAIVTLAAPDLDAHLAFRLSEPGAPSVRDDVIGAPLPPWALYVASVGWAWSARGYAVPGLDAVIAAGDGGVREGFVWETGLAFAAAWQDLGGWPTPPGGLLGLLAGAGGFFRAPGA